MRIPKKIDLHFNTAKALIIGIQESLQELQRMPAKTYYFPQEHSPESIKRRLIQARQELLVVEKSFNNLWKWEDGDE